MALHQPDKRGSSFTDLEADCSGAEDSELLAAMAEEADGAGLECLPEMLGRKEGIDALILNGEPGEDTPTDAGWIGDSGTDVSSTIAELSAFGDLLTVGAPAARRSIWQCLCRAWASSSCCSAGRSGLLPVSSVTSSS